MHKRHVQWSMSRIKQSEQDCLGRAQAGPARRVDAREEGGARDDSQEGKRRRPGIRGERRQDDGAKAHQERGSETKNGNENASGRRAPKGREKRQRAQRRSGRRAAASFYRRHGSGACHAVGISAHSCRTTKALPRCLALAAVGLLLLLPLRLPSLLALDGPGRRTDGTWCGGRPSGHAGRGCSCR